jgi:uncharacterized protein DUF3435
MPRPIFTYIERNDNLGLCVILEYAFEDNVFSSPYIKEPQDIWRYTDIQNHRSTYSVPIHFKDSNYPLHCRSYLVDCQIPRESTGILRPDTSFVPSIPKESGIRGYLIIRRYRYFDGPHETMREIGSQAHWKPSHTRLPWSERPTRLGAVRANILPVALCTSLVVPQRYGLFYCRHHGPMPWYVHNRRSGKASLLLI